jgi:hypothetical protein
MSASEIDEAQVSSSSPPCKEQLAHKHPDHTALDAHEPCFFQYFDVQQTRPKAPQLNRPHAAAFTHATAAVAPACCLCLRLLPHHPQEAASRRLPAGGCQQDAVGPQHCPGAPSTQHRPSHPMHSSTCLQCLEGGSAAVPGAQHSSSVSPRGDTAELVAVHGT